MPDKTPPDVSDAVERQLPADLALLFAALRSEMHANNQAMYSKLMLRIVLMGIPVGAVGGFVAEMVRPGSAAQAIGVVLGLF